MHGKSGVTSGAQSAIKRANEKAGRWIDQSTYALLVLDELIGEPGLPAGAILESGGNIEDVQKAIVRTVSQSGLGEVAPVERVLAHANEFVKRYGHSYIGREHLAAAVLDILDKDKHPFLAELGLDAKRIQSEIESILGLSAGD